MAGIKQLRKQLNGTKVHATIVQKGGTGKTTITSDIAYCLSQKGFKVLCIDSDSQSSLTGLCNILPDDFEADIDDEVKGLQQIYDYYIACNEEKVEPEHTFAKQFIRPAMYKRVAKKGEEELADDYGMIKEELGFDIIPSDVTLANNEIFLSQSPIGGLCLYNVIRDIKKFADYDYILIDCPPGLGSLAYNSLAASVDGCIVPVNLEVMTLRGAKNLINAVADVQKIMYSDKTAKLLGEEDKIVHKGVLGIIKNQYSSRFKVTKKFEEVMEQFFPIVSFETTIPNKISCDAAHGIHQLYSQYDKDARKAFNSLCDEIIQMDIDRKDEKEPHIAEMTGKQSQEINEGANR